MAEKIEKLTYDSFMPLYHQLKEIFLEKIETEELREGDMIPSENELQQIYSGFYGKGDLYLPFGKVVFDYK